MMPNLYEQKKDDAKPVQAEAKMTPNMYKQD